MHRPNRIGEYPILDTSAAGWVINPSDAEFVVSLGDRADYFVQTNETSTQTDVSMVSFDTGKSAINFVIAAEKSFSFGTFVNGVMLNDRPMMYVYDINVEINVAAGTGELALLAFIGRAIAGTIAVDDTAQTNQMREHRMIGAGADGANVSRTLSIRGTVIDTILDGGNAGVFREEPLGLWFSIISGAGSQTVEAIQGAMSFYRYSADIDTFDPTR